jgi:uncharacterized surface protein with fasciclin (FAS1) repeats/2',3'-cyclic-nucleotide 2'-phosphodiesterase (5'-nucleotidase family)/subtilisin family serine protease
MILEFEEAPLAVAYAEEKANGRTMAAAAIESYHQRLLNAQTAVTPKIESLGATVIANYTAAYNGMQVLTPLNKLNELRALPGVKAIHRAPVHEPALGASVPLIGTTDVWNDFGYDGDGMVIAIIDTGIDYTHAALGGSGDPADYAGNDPDVIEPGTFPTAKVIGGYDFAGTLYHAGCAAADEAAGICTVIPAPDRDPLDENGHGTHVASISAGMAAGDVSDGVAPAARLLALKVFGVSGSTALTINALDFATYSYLLYGYPHVINMSLGSNFGTNDPANPAILGSQNAAAAGIVVVASAGNAGNNSYITGSPGSADRAISVAASTTGFATGPTLNVVGATDPTQQNIIYQPASFANNTGHFVDPLTAPIGYVGALAGAADNLLCTTEGIAPDALAGHIALIQRGACTFASKVNNAASLGAVGAIIFNNAPGVLGMTGDPVLIPAGSIQMQDGMNLVPANGQLLAVSAESDVSTVPDPYTPADSIATFSSRGPRGYDSALKPEVTAPGVGIFAADVGSGAGGVSLSGTSMAAPHVAGVAALMLQGNPTWTPEQVKAVLMNTAVPLVDNTTMPLSGAGRIDAYRAVDAVVVAMGDTDLVSLSFGVIMSRNDSVTRVKQVTLYNWGDADQLFDAAVAFQTGSRTDGATLMVDPAQVTVPAGGSATVDVTLTLDMTQIPVTYGAAGAEEYFGFVSFTPPGGDPTDTLLVPFYAQPRPYSQLEEIVASGVITDPSSDIATFELTHRGPIASDLWVYPALFASEEPDPAMAGPGDVRMLGMDYVGSHPTYGDLVGVAINAWNYWHTPQPFFAEFDLYVDADQDGEWDYVNFNWNNGARTGGGNNNVWVVVQVDLSDGMLYLASPFTIYTDYNASYMEWFLPAVWQDLGPDASTFDYQMVGFDDGGVSITPPGSFDYVQWPFDWLITNDPGPAEREAEIWVGVNSLSGYNYTQPLGVMIVDYNGDPRNQNGAQAYFEPIEVVLAHRLFFPLVPSPSSLDPGLTIAGIAASNPDFSTLVAALTAAELVEPLDSPGAYTVFAPTNAAFEALPEGALEALLADPDALAAVLLYHVADGVLDAGQVVARDYITTLQGQDIEIEVTEDGVVLNGAAMVVVTNLFATNGVVHVIDAVLLPPELPTIAEIAAADENFSTLVTALGVAGLVDTLDSPGTFTVFAPTNDAFAALPENLLQAILADTDTLTAILTYHAAGEKLRSDQVVARDAITTLNGQDITVEVTEDGVVLNGTAMVTAVDILASNGVIHVIDAVLIPPEPTIATLVAGAEAFSTLATALEVTGLDAALAGPGPFTVFAPTNDAFDALPEGVLDDLLADPDALAEVLLYHVVSGIAVASDVVGLDYITTLQGQDIEIEVTEAGVVLNGAANVIGVDVLATNGVVHVIDAVLLPPELPTIAEIAVSNENFSTLVAALTVADLVEPLDSPGTFTVFAPTNDAFAALPEGLVEALLADVDALTDVLLYHVAGEKLRSDKVVASETIMMLNGDEVTVEVTEAGVVLNGAVMITAVDILASNGVVHVIDAVLLPPEWLGLTILHTNDFHARVDEYNRNGARCMPADADAGLCIAGAPRLATQVAEIRDAKANVLLLDAGDQFQGTLFYNVFKGDVLAFTMNALGYDAMTLGNHEFDSGPGVLASFIDQVDFPVVSANTDASADPDLQGKIPPYVILERGGHEIGIIGLITTDTANISSPGPNVVFTDPFVSLQDAADELTAMGVDKIIALTHMGYDVDLALAEQVSGVDIIIGGHSHSFLYSPTDPISFGPPTFPQFGPLLPVGEYPTVVESPAEEPVLVITAYQWGTFLGNLDVTFGPGGIVRFFDGNPIFLGADVAKDAELDEALEPYREAVADLIATEVGETTVDLLIVDGGQQICRLGECLMGNLVADAMLWRANQAEPGANYLIAFQNGGGLRAPILTGTVSLGDVMETLPFGNAIATFELEGQYVKAALENGASRYPSANGGFAQVSGLRYVIDPAQPVGERIASVDVWNGTDWEPLDMDAMYKVVTNDFMRRGGDNYLMFRDFAVNPYDFGPALDEALADYFREFSPVTPEIEGRITFTP